jgi:outer membrane protein OmpA-like peptidoglycan-associated protein
MTDNLLSLAQSALGGDFAKLAGQFLGESVPSTQSALSSLLPAVLGGVAQKAQTSDGLSSLMSLINSPSVDTGILDNVAGLFGSGGSGVSSLMKLGTSTLVPALFGDKAGGLVNALAGAAGIKSSSATNMLAMAVPLIFSFLKKYISKNNVSPSALATLLKGQGPHLSNSLDSRLTSALGYASPAAMLSGLGGAAADTAKRAGAAVASGAGAAASTAAAATTATKSGLMRWLPWLIGAAILLALWNMFSSKPTPPAPAPAPKAAAVPAPAPTPAPVAAAGYPFKVYFETGSAVVGPVASATVTAAAEAIKKDSAKVAITGHTDRTGDVAANEKLAKDRATAVRDALKAAGIAEGNIELRPPVFVEVGAGGPDQEARRVEINKL